MAKPKLTRGMLCRDETCTGARIAFAPQAMRKDIELSIAGYWRSDSSTWCTWSLAEWKATYDLAPPRPGRCFEAEVEL
ncbi:MAG: hypothetical protein IMZ50_15555 [Candidatus Atribacteria bacterium]|nr:hypothetical protein [Candidatus Atribacteria bacterium]